MKKKILLMTGITTGCFALIVSAGVMSSNYKSFVKINGEGPTYVLNVNRSATASEVSSGEMSVNTDGGSPIVFGFDSASTSSGVVSLASYGTFFNKTCITGLSKIEGTISSGKAIVKYGIHPEVLTFGGDLIDSSVNNGEFTINLDTPSDYFKLDCYGGTCAIENLKFTYSCANAYDLGFTTGTAYFSESVVNPKSSYKHFSYFTKTTTTHQLALRSDANRATGKVDVTIGDGTNPTVSGASDWRIVDVGHGIYFVDMRISSMGAGQNNLPAQNVDFRTSGTQHAKVAILDPTSFNYYAAESGDLTIDFSNLEAETFDDVTTSDKVVHFYTNTHSKFMFELRAGATRRTNKCTLTIGDGSNPATSGLSAGWSISYVGDGTYLVNVPVNKMGNNSSGTIDHFTLRTTGSGGGPINYADIVIN